MTDKYEGTIWEGVPQPEILIEHIKLAAAGDRRGVSGLRGAISVMKTIPARARCTQFLEFIVRKYSGYQAKDAKKL